MIRRHATAAAVLAAIAALLLADGAAAQESLHSAFSAGARASRYRSEDSDGARWGQGVEVNLPMGPAYVLQASLDRVSRTWAGSSYRVMPLQLSAIGYFTPETAASFYLLGGFGWYWTHVDGPGEHTESTSRPHAGVGFETIVASNWMFDASYRLLWSSIWRFNDYGHPWGSAYRWRGALITVGASRRF